MLEIIVPAREIWDDDRQEFLSNKEQTLTLEHSLLSISKWEAKWRKSFFSSRENHTAEEHTDYIRCMTINKNVDPTVYYSLTNDNLQSIKDYMEDPMTATRFVERKGGMGRGSGEELTSELVYCWMTQLNIPFECERWHINRLLTLVRVCSIKNNPPKKMSQREILSQYSSLNKARRAKYGTRG